MSKKESERALVVANANLNLTLQLYRMFLRRFPEATSEVASARQWMEQNPIPDQADIPPKERKLGQETMKQTAQMYGLILQEFERDISQKEAQDTSKH